MRDLQNARNPGALPSAGQVPAKARHMRERSVNRP